jgi:DNA polymerase-3 subunit delta'
MSLKDVFCQDRALGVLQRALAADRAAHAYIFAGLDGVGKYKTAREWAKVLLCHDPVTETRNSQPFVDSCGSCDSCLLFEGDSHPDYAHVYKELITFTKDGKGRTAPVDLPIDVVREFLLEKVTIRPTHAQRRVFVVSEAEKLNASSQNALLKVLEEPPHYCTIILLCTRLEQLLPTTRSRCQIVRFGPVDEERIVAMLTATGLEARQAQFFARLSRGSAGLACQWARLEREGVGLFETARSVVSSLAGLALPETLDLAERLLGDAKRISSGWTGLDKTISKTDIGRRAQKTLLQIVISVFHDAMMLNVDPGHPLVHFDQQKEIARLAGRIDPEQAARGVDEGYEALRWIDANVNERLIFERLLLRLARSAIIPA